MKAAMYHLGGDIRIEEIDEPSPPDRGEIVVRVRVCGMCGSDVTTWYMDPRAPTVLGHEPAGDIVAVGEGVDNFQVGDRVALHHHVPCMVCDRCRRGYYTLCKQFKQTRLYPAGMAEYVRVPAPIVRSDVLKIPEHLSYEAGAMVEPIACCVRALDRADIQIGDTVVIVGAGFNGITMALLAPHWGADKVAILDIQQSRLERAQALGLQTFDSSHADIKEQLAAWHGEDGPHAVICTPSKLPIIDWALGLCGPGATFVMYGPPQKGEKWAFDANHVFFQEITIRGTYSAGPYDIRRTMSFLENGIIDVNDLISHRFPLASALDAWQLTKQAQESLKVVVEI